MLQVANRPVVLVGAPHLRALSCHWLPTKVGFIEAPKPSETEICSFAVKQRVKQQMQEQSARFPQETVTFFLAGGPWVKVIAAEAYTESESLLKSKDLLLDVGSTLDGVKGTGDSGIRNINRYMNHKLQNCEQFSTAMSCETCFEECSNIDNPNDNYEFDIQYDRDNDQGSPGSAASRTSSKGKFRKWKSSLADEDNGSGTSRSTSRTSRNRKNYCGQCRNVTKSGFEDDCGWFENWDSELKGRRKPTSQAGTTSISASHVENTDSTTSTTAGGVVQGAISSVLDSTFALAKKLIS
ncbi:unnamed protein product [Amoebophrya sp. A120]|nr:unnamed protein product [Amoebophrya sp. A120]|eukprot:GSA120T00015589001.1